MSPCAKVRYRDELGAKIALANTAAAANRQGDEKRQEQRAYRCPKCKGWHLTSEPKRPTPSPGAPAPAGHDRKAPR